MSDPLWREARPNRPYGSEPGVRPRGRDPGTPAGASRTPPAGARTPRRDPGRNEEGMNRAGEVGGGQGDARGSDPRGRDPGWGGRDSGPRGGGGNGWDPGRPDGRGGDPGADAQTRRMPAPRGVRGDGSPPRGVRGDGSPLDKQQGVPGGRPPGSTQPTATRAATTQPRGTRDGAARGPAGPRDSRGRRNSPRSRGRGRLRRWGALQGGLGVCIIVASAAIGAIATMVARSAPGSPLGFFVVAGTVTAALAIRPRAGRMIFPVPVLSYLVAALLSGVVFDRSGSKTVLAIGAAQWIASGFFAMSLATVLAVVITTTRWFLRRRGRPATRDPGWPVPPAGPARTGPTRASTVWPGTAQPGTAQPGTAQPGTAQPGTGRDGTAWPPRGARETSAESGYPAGFAGPGSLRESGEVGGRGAPGGPGGPGVWGAAGPRGTGAGPRGTGPRPGPRPGAEPYNFSSGA